jgi:DNA (cytosine-5)-methyltransferase 1
VRALNLYRGAGGWEQGLKDLDVDIDGVEIMPEANATAAAAGWKTVAEDVWDLDARSIPAGYYVGLIASAPCQSYSIAGKGKGRQALSIIASAIQMRAWESLDQLKLLARRLGDERSAHVLMPLHYAYVLRPEWILLEQVPTVLPVWQETAVQLRRLGYNVWCGALRAEAYGVPQTRKRAILIASLSRSVHAPTPTHSRYYPRTPEKLDPGVKPWVSMAEALGWGLPGRPSPTVTGGGTETGGAEPIAHLDRYRDDFVMISNYGTGGDPAMRGTRSLASPGATITSHADRNFWGYYSPGQDAELVFTKAVRVSVEEAAVLQGFPRDYPWAGTKGKKYLQVGNSCPPPARSCHRRCRVEGRCR